jgi:hypothetical protein
MEWYNLLLLYVIEIPFDVSVEDPWLFEFKLNCGENSGILSNETVERGVKFGKSIQYIILVEDYYWKNNKNLHL